MDNTPIKELVKDPEWQKVRESLVGQWSAKPEWCCMQLRKYLGPIRKTDTKKLRIILNYLTGTGFRTKRIDHKCIRNLRSEVSAELRVRKFRQ